MKTITSQLQWPKRKRWLFALIFFVLAQKLSSISFAEQENPQNTSALIGQLPIGHMWQLTFQDDYVYGAVGTNLVIINITNPSEPIEVNRLDMGEIVIDIAITSEQHIYLGTPNGLWQVNAEDPSNLQIVNKHDFAYVPYVKNKGNLLFFVSKSTNSDFLHIANTSQVEFLDIIGSYSMEQADQQDVDIEKEFVFIVQGYPRYTIEIVNIATPSQPYNVGYIEGKRRRVAFTNNYLLGVDWLCSTVCVSFFGIHHLNWQTWQTSFNNASTYSNSNLSLAIESDILYAYVGKDVGLLVFNYHQQPINQSLPILAHYDVGNVNDIALTEEYILAATDRGFFVMPRPLIYTSHLPLVAHQGSFTD